MNIEEVGITGARFVTETSSITDRSIIYSFGVGDNIEWDKAMTERFGCKVYAFDPDPLAIEWLKKQSFSNEFIFTPVGVGAYDGEQVFYQPYKANKINKSSINKTPFVSRLPVKRIQTLMREKGHDHVDVMKVNIEGGEYSIIPDIVKVSPSQIIIEFHDRFIRHFGKLYNWLAFFRLWRRGYSLVAVDDHVLTYLKRSD